MAGHTPNLVLMKLSALYKESGYETELLKPSDVLKGGNLFCGFSYLYGACVFTWNHPTADALANVGVHVGGTGTVSKRNLPYEAEHIMPDYSLYGVNDVAYGFLTRGCPRKCPFCIVSGKEGVQSRKVADISEFWTGQKHIVLMDPNILACPDSLDLLQQLAESKACVDINQGLDARLLTEENILAINKIKVKMIHFAWDNYEFKTYEKLKRFRPLMDKDGRHIRVYVLTNFNTSHEQDLERIYKLRELDYDPFVMIYDKPNAPRQTKQLQRWCNNKWIFRA